jgi:hypothetical protein
MLPLLKEPVAILLPVAYFRGHPVASAGDPQGASGQRWAIVGEICRQLK